MKDEIKRAKTAAFCSKYKINFLLLVGVLFLINGFFYEITQIIPLTNHHLHMAIDDAIPMIPEFVFFYQLFYLTPIVFLYALSFYDKKKLVTIVVDGTISIVICFIVYCVYNVQMIRPEAEVAPYMFGNGSIHSIRDLCKALIHIQYIVDPLARNGIPSLHAMFAGLIFLSGCPMGKNERYSPIILRIFAIIFGLGITCSTFFIKQHYFIDAIVGFALAIIIYFVSKIIVNKIIKKYPENKTIKLLVED